MEWTAEVSGQATRIAVDPTDGRVVVAGAYRSPLRLTVLDRGGQVRQDLTTDVLMRSVVDLEVDPTSGLACTLGSQGRKNSEKRSIRIRRDPHRGMLPSHLRHRHLDRSRRARCGHDAGRCDRSSKPVS